MWMPNIVRKAQNLKYHVLPTFPVGFFMIIYVVGFLQILSLLETFVYACVDGLKSKQKWRPKWKVMKNEGLPIVIDGTCLEIHRKSKVFTTFWLEFDIYKAWMLICSAMLKRITVFAKMMAKNACLFRKKIRTREEHASLAMALSFWLIERDL